MKTSGTAQAPIRFEAAPGERVVLTGADRLTGWQRADDARPIYRVAWPHKFVTWNRSMAHPDDEYHRVIGRCEQVAADGSLLRQVLSADQWCWPGGNKLALCRDAVLERSRFLRNRGNGIWFDIGRGSHCPAARAAASNGTS